jgi:molybdopterin converting factor small subunit
MNIVVKFAGPLRAAAGVKEMAIDLQGNATTGAVLCEVAERNPGVRLELFGPDPKHYFSVFVNDLLVPEKEREQAPVHEGDEVMILLPIAGGCLQGLRKCDDASPAVAWSNAGFLAP